MKRVCGTCANKTIQLFIKPEMNGINTNAANVILLLQVTIFNTPLQLFFALSRTQFLG